MRRDCTQQRARIVTTLANEERPNEQRSAATATTSQLLAFELLLALDLRAAAAAADEKLPHTPNGAGSRSAARYLREL